MFKEKTGENFMDYLIKIRIGESKKLLLGTDLKLQDICELLGYNKVSYFIIPKTNCPGTSHRQIGKDATAHKHDDSYCSQFVNEGSL